jgi:uncharacterized protein (TIGR02145 family)
MKKNLLLMMLCCPIVLVAQNGVAVSNLAVDAGTVTFNVSWKKPMPVELWSDTVWVFVDYNNNGKMERLPLSPGATLTTTSPGGQVIEEPDNNQGVWVAGNARTNSSFSATVQLLTAVSNVGGACVYGSNYPPVGESLSASEISFTGTPKYDLVLEKIADGSTYTISTTGLYAIHAGEVIQSFTDATGAPGIMKCTAPGSTVNFTAFNPCPTATTGDYWYLTDTREAAYGNTQTYKVKKLPDGHIWMVQDLKFGDKCNKSDFTRSTSDRTGNVTSLTDKLYYGDCKNVADVSIPSKGYYYDWAAAINLPKAYYGSGVDVGCSGTDASAYACQGICPNGWHVPTGNTTGEPSNLSTFNMGCDYNTLACWMSAVGFEAVLGGWIDDYGSVMYPEHWDYWTSTKIGNSIYVYSGGIDFLRTADDNPAPGGGFRLRCIQNY